MAQRSTKKDMRKWFARQLGLAAANERFIAIWDQIEEDGNLPLEDDDGEGWDFALHEARRLLAYEEKRGKPVRRQRDMSKEITPTLDEAESRRANAMMLYWAKNAACEPEVRSFRKRVLNNRLLTLDDARVFLESPLLGAFPQSKIEEAGIPIVGHTARWKRKQGEKVSIGFYWHLAIDVESHGIQMSYDRIATEPLEHLWYPGEDGYGRAVDVWPHSVMHDLLSVSESIAKRYGWDGGRAPIFILTDIIPYAHALTYAIETDALGRQSVTITVEPWVTMKTVLGAYRQAQLKVYSGVPGPIGEKSAALFEFVIERMDEDGRIPSFRALMGAWNCAQSRDDWKYLDARLFERDYNRAKQSLLHPRLREHPPKTFEEMTPAEQIADGLRRYFDNHADNQGK